MSNYTELQNKVRSGGKPLFPTCELKRVELFNSPILAGWEGRLAPALFQPYLILQFGITICKPKALLFHGREARLFANRYFKVELDAYSKPKEQRVTAVIPGTTILSSLFAYHHFVGRVESHSVMEEHLKEFAEQIHLRVTQHAASKRISHLQSL